MTGVRGAGLACSLVASLTMAAAAVCADAPPVSQPYRLSPHFAPGDRYMGIRLLGTVELAPASIDGLTLGGLSGLAWDQDAAKLYALSDRGSLFHLRPNFENGRLVGAELLAGFALRDPQNRPLAGRRADAEGIVLRPAGNGEPGKSRLAVSFERYPRIVLFTPRGEHVKSLHLPADLGDPDRYATPNKALEVADLACGSGLSDRARTPAQNGCRRRHRSLRPEWETVALPAAGHPQRVSGGYAGPARREPADPRTRPRADVSSHGHSAAPYASYGR